MTRLAHRLAPLLTLVCLLPAAAQPTQPPAAGATLPPAELGRIAYEDIEILAILDVLHITPEQATQLRTPIQTLQEQLKRLDEREATLLSQAGIDVMGKRARLLRGERVPNEDVRRLAQFEANRKQLEREREDEVFDTYTRLLDLLSEAQRRQLGEGRNAPLPTDGAPGNPLGGVDAEALAEQAKRREAIYQRMVELMENTHRTDPRQFETLAPPAIAQAVTELTGLAIEQDAAQQLARYLYDRLGQLLRMNPGEYQQNGQQIALELSRAVMYTTQTSGPARPTGPAMTPATPVAPELLEQVMTYARTPELLLALGQMRQGPMD